MFTASSTDQFPHFPPVGKLQTTGGNYRGSKSEYVVHLWCADSTRYIKEVIMTEINGTRENHILLKNWNDQGCQGCLEAGRNFGQELSKQELVQDVGKYKGQGSS